MARINSYAKDAGLSADDKLVGSSYEGTDQTGPIYKTRTYTLGDLADYFGGFIQTGEGGNINIVELEQTVTENTSAIASAQQSITTITNELLAQSTFKTNLASTFGTFDENGNLVSLSQAFADQVLQTTASDRYANAQFVTNLAASVGTYDANGNLITLGQAFADQVLSTTASDRFATSTFATNLAASFGTYNSDGTLATISESFANQLLQASTASDFADAQFVTNLMSNFGTFDSNGNILTISTSYADQLLQTANTAEFAQASFATNLASSFGTYNSDGSMATFSQSFADQVLSTANTSNLASASFVTNLATSLGTYDGNGNLLSISSSFADDVLSTANTSEFAEASKLTALGASFGTVNPDGSVSFSNTSTFSDALLTYVDESSSLASQLTQLQTTVTNIPVTIRQDDAPDILDANNDLIYPLGSIWVDTNDNNAIYILVEDTGAPSGYAWSATTSEALGTLIQSNAELQEDVDLISTNLSSQGTKLTTLTAQFGVYDPATNTFTINNNATVIDSLRTYADADSAAATKVDSIGSTFGAFNPTTNAFTVSNAKLETIVDTLTLANYASTSRIDTLEAQVDGNSADIETEQEVRASADSANASYALNIASSIGTVDASGNITAVSEAFANSIINTETTSDYAAASRVDTLEATVGDANSGLVSSVQTASDAIADINGNLSASYGVYVNTAGKVAGLKLLATGATQPSQFIAQADTFAVDMPNGTRVLTVDSNGLVINGSGTFSGTLQAGQVRVASSEVSVFSNADYSSTGAINFKDSNGQTHSSITTDVIQIPTSQGPLNVASLSIASGMNLSLSAGIVGISGADFSANVNTITLTGGTNTLQISSSGLIYNGSPVSTGSNVSNAAITVRGTGVLGGTGTFTLNQSSNQTVSITHDTSAQGSVSNSAGTVIQSITVDGYGHISGIGSVNLDGRYLTSLPSHTHDDRYYTEQEINSILASYATQNYVTSALSPYALASSIPTATSQLTNDSGYITSGALTGYATETYVNNAVPSGSQISQWNSAYNFSVYGGTVSGNLYANDFILNSDATLKENIKDYVAKPINIKYKKYNLIGDDSLRVGVIAQELEKDHPEFVKMTDNGTKAVSYIDMLVAKIAELEDRIKQLENGSAS